MARPMLTTLLTVVLCSTWLSCVWAQPLSEFGDRAVIITPDGTSVTGRLASKEFRARLGQRALTLALDEIAYIYNGSARLKKGPGQRVFATVLGDIRVTDDSGKSTVLSPGQVSFLARDFLSGLQKRPLRIGHVEVVFHGSGEDVRMVPTSDPSVQASATILDEYITAKLFTIAAPDRQHVVAHEALVVGLKMERHSGAESPDLVTNLRFVAEDPEGRKTLRTCYSYAMQNAKLAPAARKDVTETFQCFQGLRGRGHGDIYISAPEKEQAGPIRLYQTLSNVVRILIEIR